MDRKSSIALEVDGNDCVDFLFFWVQPSSQAELEAYGLADFGRHDVKGCRCARVSVEVCCIEIGSGLYARGAELLMFARKAEVGAWWRGCESCLQKRRDWLIYGRGGGEAEGRAG